MGFGPMLKSRVLRERLSECNETLMSRSEHTTTFKCIEGEKSFFAKAEMILEELNNFHDTTIDIINSSIILQKLNCQISRQELWEIFFFGIKKTIVIKAGK
jgi:hypothetical protein